MPAKASEHPSVLLHGMKQQLYGVLRLTQELHPLGPLGMRDLIKGIRSSSLDLCEEKVLFFLPPQTDSEVFRWNADPHVLTVFYKCLEKIFSKTILVIIKGKNMH